MLYKGHAIIQTGYGYFIIGFHVLFTNIEEAIEYLEEVCHV